MSDSGVVALLLSWENEFDVSKIVVSNMLVEIFTPNWKHSQLIYMYLRPS